MAREGLASLFPIEELSIVGLAAVVEAVAEDPAADPANRRRGDGSLARYSRDHRQPRFYPSGGATRSRPRSVDPDRRLRLAVGLGVAARPGARDAPLCRSCAGAAAVRAGGLSQAARSALQLCRPSPDRADRRAAAGCRRADSAGTDRRRCFWCCREAAAAKSGITWRCSAKRWAGCRRRAWRSSWSFRPCRICRKRSREGVKGWPVQPRIVVGEQEKRAAFRIAHAALAKSGTVTLELALAGRADGRGLQGRSGRGLDPAARDHGAVGDPGQSRDRRKCRAGIPPAGLHARKSWRRRCAKCWRTRRCGGASSRPSQGSTRSCRPATSSPSVRAADIVLATMRKSRRTELGKTRKPDAMIAPAFRDPMIGAVTCAWRYRRSRGG